jgi:hypothetical protein
MNKRRRKEQTRKWEKGWTARKKMRRRMMSDEKVNEKKE